MRDKQQTISFFTLGCRLNQNETEILQQTFLTDKSYKIVSPNNPADICVINTCTVTEKSDSDTRKFIHKLIRLNPKIQIALIGCQSQTQKEKLTELPNVRWIIGNEKKLELLDIFKENQTGKNPQVITPTISPKNFSLPISDVKHNRSRANLKIQDGCNFFCSYCEVPYARGRARSRIFDNILEEARALAQAGHKEIVITGVNVGTYKQDKYKLIDVITALEQISGLERIRISSIEFTTINDVLLKKMATKSKLCRFLHVPLQSANDEILKAMNRKYSFKDFHHFIQKTYETIPDICLGTDIIVGFPGETEKHFIQTYQRLEALPVSYLHVFSYSKRHLAKSRLLKNEVPTATIQKRSKILRQLSIKKRNLFHQSLLGSTQKILFEEKKGDSWSGLTDNYVRVHLKSEKNLKNKIIPVSLEKNLGQIILGKLKK